jgi:hypothetical protein
MARSLREVKGADLIGSGRFFGTDSENLYEEMICSKRCRGRSGMRRGLGWRKYLVIRKRERKSKTVK